VLLFIDNIFRFTQAGSEVSALLGRIPLTLGVLGHEGSTVVVVMNSLRLTRFV